MMIERRPLDEVAPVPCQDMTLRGRVQRVRGYYSRSVTSRDPRLLCSVWWSLNGETTDLSAGGSLWQCYRSGFTSWYRTETCQLADQGGGGGYTELVRKKNRKAYSYEIYIILGQFSKKKTHPFTFPGHVKITIIKHPRPFSIFLQNPFRVKLWW